MVGSGWSRYLAGFHDANPAITEQALGRSHHPGLGTPYDWMAAAVPDPAGDVIDLACGSCPLHPLLRFHSYLGVDTSEAELEVALGKGRGPVHRGDVTDLPVAAQSVDTVVMSMALMLVPVPATLAEVSRVLRPGGVFVAMLPARWPLRVRDLLPGLAVGVTLFGPGSMPQTLGPRRVRRELERRGLTVTSLQRQRFAFPVRSEADAALAVRALYTPRRRDAQRRAATWLLSRLPGRVELPVPLLLVVARASVDAAGR